MSRERVYVLDSDVFIAAKNAYYAFTICPGFWDSLIHFHGMGRLLSIDRVQGELLAGRETEDLVRWVKTDAPQDMFAKTDDAAVVEAFSAIMRWVYGNTQYFDGAKATFATEADGWLVADAMVHGGVVATNEQPRPESRRRIPLPDVCATFGVPYVNTFVMLTDLKARFEWADPA